MHTILWTLKFNYIELSNDFLLFFLNIRQSGKCLEYKLQRKKLDLYTVQIYILYTTGGSLETNDIYIYISFGTRMCLTAVAVGLLILPANL